MLIAYPMAVVQGWKETTMYQQPQVNKHNEPNKLTTRNTYLYPVMDGVGVFV